MKGQSDLVQGAALAYAEREVMEAGLAALMPRGNSNGGGGAAGANGPLVEALLQLYGLRCVEADLAWFMTQGIIAPAVGRAIPAGVRALVSRLGPRALDLIQGFGIPEHLVAAPIAADWEAYNAVDNRGEVRGTGGAKWARSG